MSAIRIPVSGSPRPALVDHWNGFVQQHSWSLNGAGYAHTRCGNDLVYLHVMLVCPPPHLTVDHIDRDRLNCLEENMRLASRQEQAWNQGLRCDNTSGFKGVCFSKRGRAKPWVAQIQTPGMKRRSAYFASAQEAAAQYDAWAVEYYGEFASTNASLALL